MKAFTNIEDDRKARAGAARTTFSLCLRRTAVVLAAASVLLLSGCKSEVYQGLTEQQANVMMSVLMKHGIVPEKAALKEGYSLSVESSQVARTLELMRENNLPRPAFENMGEIFAAKGMISSSTEEQARLTYALSQELAETFSQIDGVLTARVHVVLATSDAATGQTTPASAGVFLRYTPESQAPDLVSRIQVLTANAVPGLESSRVSVMLVPVRETATIPMAPQAEGGLSKYAAAFAGVLFALSLGALGAAGVLYRRAKADVPGAPRKADKEDGKPAGRDAVRPGGF